MIQRLAIYHQPLSNYAFATDENTIVIRLRVARDNLVAVRLHYGDTAYPGNPVQFATVDMVLVGSDDYFDIYEARLHDAYRRCIYYFELADAEETLYYYSGIFYNHISDMRNDLYKFPYNRKEDIVRVPEWIKHATIYNIFPDSFTNTPQAEPKMLNQAGIPIKNRLGGSLKDIRDRLDYIQDLGFNTIYLNPIFKAGEYHKYDVVDYYQIDPWFGSNDDFKAFVDTCHARGMRVIIDGVFNHSGWQFFAFRDVLKHQENSAYKDWYYGLDFPISIPTKPHEKPRYECFGYERRMPKLNTSNPEVVRYFMDVCRYWIETYDIDGWRLDVADEVNTEFWREFRKAAKAAKPDCVLIGEVWQNATFFLDGSMFDSTMNYDFLKHAKDFFAYQTIDAWTFDGRMTDMRMRYREPLTYAQLNLLDSHDVPRFLSVVHGDKARFRLAMVTLMTAIGAPSVFYGDEQSLEGIAELDYRRPMDFDHDPLMATFFKALIQIRQSHICLRTGRFDTLHAKQNSGLYIYQRSDDLETLVIVINNSETNQALPWLKNGFDVLLSDASDTGQIGPYGFQILKKRGA